MKTNWRERFKKEWQAEDYTDIFAFIETLLEEVIEDFPSVEYWDVDDTPTLKEYKQQLRAKWLTKD